MLMLTWQPLLIQTRPVKRLKCSRDGSEKGLRLPPLQGDPTHD
jgi:hypothetical protein